MPQLELIIVLIWLATSGGADPAAGPRARAVRPADTPKRQVAPKREAEPPRKPRALSSDEEKALRRRADRVKRPAFTARVMRRLYDASRDADHFRDRLVGWHYGCEDDPEAGTFTIRLREGGVVYVSYDVKTRKLLWFRFDEPTKPPVRLLGGA
jgi:hypothetical protein